MIATAREAASTPALPVKSLTFVNESALPRIRAAAHDGVAR